MTPAVDYYRKALERDPNAVMAANNLGWLYAVQGKGDIDEAVRLAQGVVQKNSTIAGFVDTLGMDLLQEGSECGGCGTTSKSRTLWMSRLPKM